ncbi:DDE-type integrase/transposase/recombinase [Pseudogemmobacter bohemicus]|uniref:DDE-type integrase/transposase/recombinase n=1 Tax=Pseudogemmobacter bohemicus TaxID=2250708 RepID=UPI000DD368C4|nr:DDE-type integrase/transposase/recombinase [Pseudogemmobacter bohemicus]
MTVVPKFDLAAGSKLTILHRDVVLVSDSEEGYEFCAVDTGESLFVPFLDFVNYIKLPGVRIDAQLPVTGNRLQVRLGGVRTSQNLPENQREHASFHLAICQAIKLLRDKLRRETGDPKLELSIRTLDQSKKRKFIGDVAQQIFGKKIYLQSKRGGKGTTWTLYKGRTLARYMAIYDGLHPDEDPLDALIPLDHLKGNWLARINDRVKVLMTQAWDKFGLDTKSPAISDVMRFAKVLIREDNALRARNDLPLLQEPSESTLRAHRDYLLSPTEYMLATKGERFARNKRGRGSTDIRALFVGEYVEVDECHASLVLSAKIYGHWEGLAPDFRGKLEEIDKVIRERLTILVMIDVATRMPLAWVISDRPKAEATLELFRMATRDKTREKLKYGCSGEPVAAIGLGHVKNDNGPGLRNSTCVSALMGVGAMNTVARAYNSTDKPYVERMFGIEESVLLRILHGYTGRKPNDLPGYDATAAGVLDIDELYGILTRFMIDAYPSMRNMGVGMGGRRPYEVYKETAETRGCVRPIDPNMRRIHLGWEEEVTPTDEGVRVFSGIWFNSDELQLAIDNMRRKDRKVRVFIDPDDMSRATVLVPGELEPIEVHLQMTAFASLTLVEILDLIAAWRRENPRLTEVHDDRVTRFFRDTYQMMKTIGVERKLPRSYSTIGECRAKAKAVFAGARVLPGRVLQGTTAPEDITRIDATENVFQIGDADSLIEGELADPDAAETQLSVDSDLVANSLPDLASEPKPKPKPKRQRQSKSKSAAPTLGRPVNMKELE